MGVCLWVLGTFGSSSLLPLLICLPVARCVIACSKYVLWGCVPVQRLLFWEIGDTASSGFHWDWDSNCPCSMNSALQTTLVSGLRDGFVFSGHHDEALAVAERGRTRAFADLLVERQTGQQDSDPYSPVTLDQVLETVNGQRGLVLYYSLAAGYLYSWLLAPGAGELVFGHESLGTGLTKGE